LKVIAGHRSEKGNPADAIFRQNRAVSFLGTAIFGRIRTLPKRRSLYVAPLFHEKSDLRIQRAGPIGFTSPLGDCNARGRTI
jgi:hypothetical protein